MACADEREFDDYMLLEDVKKLVDGSYRKKVKKLAKKHDDKIVDDDYGHVDREPPKMILILRDVHSGRKWP